jgi:hypothetical protein
MSRFAALSLTLGELFSDPFVAEAPAYQRPYSWTTKEAGRLLDDLLLALNGQGENKDHGGGDYFIGTMLFVDRASAASHMLDWPRGGPPRSFEVVDGQQRLTTFTILFSALRDLGHYETRHVDDVLLRSIRAGDGSFRLRLRDPDAAFLAAHVQNDGASHAMPSHDGLSLGERNLMAVREQFLEELIYLEPVERQKLARFLFENCTAVLIVTRDIDRAHHMFMVLNETGKPLARNDILKAELLGSVPASEADRVTQVWDQARGLLGDDFESLFSHIRVMHGRPGPQVIAGIRAIVSEVGGATKFVEQVMVPAVQVIDQIRRCAHFGSPHSVTIQHQLVALNRLTGSEWMASVILFWLRYRTDAARLAQFLIQIDRLCYCLRVLGVGADKRMQRLAAIVSAIRAGQALEGLTSLFTLSREEQRSIVYNLRDLHGRSPKTCKLILLRLNDEIAGVALRFVPEGLTVEHVLPKRTSTNSPWRSRFPDSEQRERCIASLGNLVLVSKAQNDRAANLDFANKLDVYFNTPGAPTLALTDQLRGRKNWTVTDIEQREKVLLGHLARLWQLEELLSRKVPSPEFGESARRGRRHKPVGRAGAQG